MANIGDKIRIIYMVDEPQYRGREGIITEIDDLGYRGTWGGLTVIPGEDDYIVLEEEN